MKNDERRSEVARTVSDIISIIRLDKDAREGKVATILNPARIANSQIASRRPFLAGDWQKARDKS